MALTEGFQRLGRHVGFVDMKRVNPGAPLFPMVLMSARRAPGAQRLVTEKGLFFVTTRGTVVLLRFLLRFGGRSGW